MVSAIIEISNNHTFVIMEISAFLKKIVFYFLLTSIKRSYWAGKLEHFSSSSKTQSAALKIRKNQQLRGSSFTLVYQKPNVAKQWY